MPFFDLRFLLEAKPEHFAQMLILDTTSAATFRDERQHDICSPKSCGLGFELVYCMFLLCEWLLTLELR